MLAGLWAVAALLLWRTKVPGDLAPPRLDQDEFFDARAIDRAGEYERFLRASFLLSQAALVAVLALYARYGERLTRESAAGRIGTGMLLGMLGLAFVWLSQLPFGVANLWWQRRYDVARASYVDWILGNWLGLAGEFLFICLAILIVMALAGVLGSRWWIAGGPAFVGLVLVFAWAYPYLIPDLKPLDDPALAADARELARAEGVPEIPVKVEEVSAVTTAPNAEAAGLGDSRRVILWDTLLEEFPRDQVRVVLAHEFAHISRNHVAESVGWYALFAVPGALLIAVATRRRGGMADPRAVPLSILVLVVLELAALPAQNAISRHMEAEADWIALETTRDPAAARGLFEGFTEEALAQPSPPTWSFVLLDGHPTIMQRLAMVEAWERRSTRQRGQAP